LVRASTDDREQEEGKSPLITSPPTPGVGFFSMVGTGVLVQSGVIYSFATGPVLSVLTGGSVFVGAGGSYNVGVINIFSASTNSHHGQGTIGASCCFVLLSVCVPFLYLFITPSHFKKTVYDVGDSVWIGCPVASAIAILAFYGLGGVFSHPG
jgi:hypothetical protein